MISLEIVIDYWDNLNEKSHIDIYKLFSSETTIYVKYTRVEVDEDNTENEKTDCFNFSKLETLKDFIHKRFKQVKRNDRYELNEVLFELYKNENVLMSDRLDWEFTGFFRFKKMLDEYLNFVKYMNIEHNTKLLNNFLIKHTKNDITNNLPQEIIDIIMMNI